MNRYSHLLLVVICLVACVCAGARAEPVLPGVVAATRVHQGRDVYVVTRDGQVDRNGEQITHAGIVRQIVVMRGVVFGLGTDGAVYRLGRQWEKVTHNGVVIRFSMTPDNTIHGIGTDHNLYHAQIGGPWKR